MGKGLICPAIDGSERGRGVEVVGEAGPYLAQHTSGIGAGPRGHGTAPAGEPVLGRLQQGGCPVAIVAVVIGEERQPYRGGLDTVSA